MQAGNRCSQSKVTEDQEEASGRQQTEGRPLRRRGSPRQWYGWTRPWACPGCLNQRTGSKSHVSGTRSAAIPINWRGPQCGLAHGQSGIAQDLQLRADHFHWIDRTYPHVAVSWGSVPCQRLKGGTSYAGLPEEGGIAALHGIGGVLEPRSHQTVAWPWAWTGTAPLAEKSRAAYRAPNSKVQNRAETSPMAASCSSLCMAGGYRWTAPPPPQLRT